MVGVPLSERPDKDLTGDRRATARVRGSVVLKGGGDPSWSATARESIDRARRCWPNSSQDRSRLPASVSYYPNEAARQEQPVELPERPSTFLPVVIPDDCESHRQTRPRMKRDFDVRSSIDSEELDQFLPRDLIRKISDEQAHGVPLPRPMEDPQSRTGRGGIGPPQPDQNV
jgi:hypothetical protein